MTASADLILQRNVVLPGYLVERLIRQPDARYTAAWFDTLPALVDSWCERWQIVLDTRLPKPSYHIVLFGHSATAGPVVLKLTAPDDEFAAEVAGLKATRGQHMVRLLYSDLASAGMLLERVLPGTALRDQENRTDNEGTRIAAESLLSIWTAPPASPGDLIPLERWFRILFRYEEQLRNGRADRPLPQDVTITAVAAARLLLATDDPVVLHGDLHHDNILINRSGGWTIIDPKGLIGDRSYDVGTWMLNPPPASETAEYAILLARRTGIFADVLGIDRSRIIAGALVHSALAASWAVVDATPEDYAEDTWLANSIEATKVFARMYERA